MIRIHWRPLIPGERDPELLWGAVICSACVVAAAWLLIGLPTPPCPLHALTGIPCPSCGITRGLLRLLNGSVMEAFLFNPLIMTVLAGVVLYVPYAALVVIGRLPRLRWEPLPEAATRIIHMTAVILVLLNWICLILRERFPA